MQDAESQTTSPDWLPLKEAFRRIGLCLGDHREAKQFFIGRARIGVFNPKASHAYGYFQGKNLGGLDRRIPREFWRQLDDDLTEAEWARGEIRARMTSEFLEGSSEPLQLHDVKVYETELNQVLARLPPLSGAVVVSTALAIKDCEAWLRLEFEADPFELRRKSSFKDAALSKFQGRLSGHGFVDAWKEVAPDYQRTKPGRRPSGPKT